MKRHFYYKTILSFGVLFFLTICIHAQNIKTSQKSDSLVRPYRVYDSGDKNFDLILAAEAGDKNMVLKLLNQGADVNTTTIDGVSPLMYASEKGYFDVSRILILNGAEINMQPSIGPPALIGAVRAGQYNLTELLINNGADISIKDDKGAQSLHYAAAYIFNDILDMLLFYRANPNAPDNNGSTPLMAAVWANNEEAVDILIELGANPNIIDNQGFSNVHLAAQNGNDFLVELFSKNQSLLDKPNKEGWTPLATAIIFEHTNTTRLLINKGANINHPISYAENPLEIAISTKNDSIINLLKKKGAIRKWQPAFQMLSIGLNNKGNTDDYYLGVNLGLFERKYKFSVNAGYMIRPFKNRVLRKENEKLYYQFWERRSILYLGIEKQFSLTNRKNNEFGILLGARANYSFGKYFGSTKELDSDVTYEPQLGAYIKGKRTYFYLCYSYLDLKLPEFSSHFIELGLSYAFSFRDDSHKLKQFKWY